MDRCDEYRTLAGRLDRLTSELAEMRFAARSADDIVLAVVGPTGELRELHFDEEAAAGVELPLIARAVVEAATQAAGDARTRRLAAVGALLPEHLRDVVALAAKAQP